MKKILGITALVLVIVGLYQLGNEISSGLFPYLTSYKEIILSTNPLTSVTGSFIIGLIIGSIACPVCSLPLIGYVMGAEPTAKKAFWASVTFHGGRLIVFMFLGIITAGLGHIIPDRSIPTGFSNLINGMVGIIMILFSMELFGLINLNKYISKKVLQKIKIPYVSVDHPIHLLLWGMLIGFGCSVEYIIPLLLAIFVSVSETGFAYAMLAVFLFSIGTMITPTILIVMAGGSVEVTAKYAGGNLRKYAGWIGGLILLYVGLHYLIAFLFTLLG